MVKKAATKGPLENFLALGASEVAARFVGFYATALLARKLGVDAFGALGFATGVVSYFGITLTAGFGDIGAAAVAREPAAARRIAADATAVRLLIALAGMGTLTILSLGFVASPVYRVVLLASTVTLVAPAFDTSWVYRGLSRNRTAGLALLLGQSAYLAAVILFVNAPGDVVRVPAIQAAGELLGAGLLLVLLFRLEIPRPGISRGIAMLRQSGFITASRLLRTLIVTFDVLLLAFLATSRDVGLYTAAYRVCMLVTMVVVATHAVFLPGIVRAATEGPIGMTAIMSRSLFLTSAVILPIVVGGIVLARPLLIFLFGPDYSAGSTAFQLLLASIALLSLHGIAHNVFIALHQTGREAAIYGVAAAVNIALNLLLIPTYGLVGAASATLAAEALTVVTTAFSLSRLGLKPALSRIVLPLVASLLMGAVVYSLSGRLPVWALVPLGGLIYLLVFGGAGGIRSLIQDSRDDIRAINA